MDVTIQLTTYLGLNDRITILRAADEVDAVFIKTERFNVLVGARTRLVRNRTLTEFVQIFRDLQPVLKHEALG